MTLSMQSSELVENVNVRIKRSVSLVTCIYFFCIVLVLILRRGLIIAYSGLEFILYPCLTLNSGSSLFPDFL